MFISSSFSSWHEGLFLLWHIGAAAVVAVCIKRKIPTRTCLIENTGIQLPGPPFPDFPMCVCVKGENEKRRCVTQREHTPGKQERESKSCSRTIRQWRLRRVISSDATAPWVSQAMANKYARLAPAAGNLSTHVALACQRHLQHSSSTAACCGGTVRKFFGSGQFLRLPVVSGALAGGLTPFFRMT